MFLEPARLFRAIAACSLISSALLFFLWSWHWPLVGDASLIHYIGFLIERGWAPYRDLGDMNMPGSYLIELAAMHVFGPGDLAWRLFDFSLLAVASDAFLVISQRKNWFAGLFAACLFLLVHGRDGLAQGGQRDLTMAVCLITATAFLFIAIRKSANGRNTRAVLWSGIAFGLLSGVATTIKPTVLPLSLAQFLLALYVIRCRRHASPSLGREILRQSLAGYVMPAILAWLIAPLASLFFLVKQHALAAFVAGFHGIVPYYASLGHRPLGYILLHSLSPLLSLVLLWIAVLALDKTLLRSTFHWSHDWERGLLLIGCAFGLFNCVVQARALPYYRYPLLVFLLPLMALDFTQVFNSVALAHNATPRKHAATALAILALSIGSFFLAPQSAVLIHRYRWWEMDFITSLEYNLEGLGGSRLSGHIQCIDSISGCGTVLYRMRLEPSTGVLSDFLLFGPPEVPIIRQTRQQLETTLLTNPPEVIVITGHLHMDGPDNYRKLDRWPGFASLLADRYNLETQWSPTRTNRWWSREEKPDSYRIYVLK